MPDIVPIKRALISVSDKSGLVAFAQALAARGVEILSTGGSAQALREANVPVKEVAEHTGFPEILDGRVKTLVPQIHGGILGRRDNAEHLAQMAAHDIAPIDLVAVNLYPFEATVAKGAPDCRMCRKHRHRRPGADPRGGEEPRFRDCADGAGPIRYRAGRTRRAWRHDAGVAPRVWPARLTRAPPPMTPPSPTWFAEQRERHGRPVPAPADDRRERCGKRCAMAKIRISRPAFYVNGSRPGVATARQVQGKELSYNNLRDTDAAFECVAEFDEPTVAIIKHANPCGVASAATLAEAWDLAFRCDPVSPYRRHRRGEPDAGRGGGGKDRGDLDRGHRRAGRRPRRRSRRWRGGATCGCC